MKILNFIILSILISLLPNLGNAYEGAGLLVSDQQGALPKALWRGQPRSEIAHLMRNLPADSDMISIQRIKRNMLLSYYDTSLIENDIPPTAENDLLTLRLEKLFEMGLWEDALSLYTKNVTDPGNNEPLARIGILLTLSKRGVPTTCLEEKVIGDRFKEKDFWINLAALCEREIYDDSTIKFSNSSVLEAIYHSNDFKIPSKNIGILQNLSFLEKLMLIRKQRIHFDDNTPENTPPFLLKLYLSDSNANKAITKDVEKQSVRQGILPSPTPKINTDKENREEKEVIRYIVHALKHNASLQHDIITEWEKTNSKESNNYIILQIIKEKILSKTLKSKIDYSFNKQKYNFKKDQKETLIYLTEGLDKAPEFSNNRRKAYEKHIALDSAGNNTLNSSWQEWLQATTKHNFSGLTLLIVLNNLDSFAFAANDNLPNDNMSEEKQVNMLASLSNVGLNNTVQQIAKNVLANLMDQ